jgi:hypothetical protein
VRTVDVTGGRRNFLRPKDRLGPRRHENAVSPRANVVSVSPGRIVRVVGTHGESESDSLPVLVRHK